MTRNAQMVDRYENDDKNDLFLLDVFMQKEVIMLETKMNFL